MDNHEDNILDVQVGDIWRYDWQSYRSEKIQERFMYYLILARVSELDDSGMRLCLSLDSGITRNMSFRISYSEYWRREA